MSDIALGATSAELDRLRQIPDVQQYFSTQNSQNQDKQRRLLYVSSLLIVLATTLFYAGYSKQLFSEIQFEYSSQGIIFENETRNVFSRWRDILTPEQRANDEFVALRKVEIARRTKYDTILLHKNAGPDLTVNVQGGYRYYRFNGKQQIKRRVNAWLQIAGVLMLSAGIMGFVLERRLFKSSL
ncbi:MAG: hypothetical protein JKY14_07360 [Paraglaciecola sp.]|nr:hypothetical protein [Paraglaciecola sp.]